MTLFGTTFNLIKPYLDESMGQFYIEELDLTTPLAPQPDRVLDGVNYWSHKGFHDYNTAVVRSTLPFIEKRLEDNGLKSAYPYPPNPVMPYATLTFDGDSYYNIETMMGHARQTIRRCLDHAIYQPLQGLNMDYKVPCGKIVSTPNMSSTHDHVCKAGSLCPACREIVRLRGIIDDVADKQLTPEEKAKARLSAVVRDITATKIPTSDPKYAVIGGKICNAETGVAIPDDEPIFILRAKDSIAAETIMYYAMRFRPGTPIREALDQQFLSFVDFAAAHPECVKNAD